MLRAGDAGRTAAEKGDGDGFGGFGGAGVGLVMLCDDGCRGKDGTVGAVGAVGVACGVEAAELAFATEIGAGVCRWFIAAVGGV